MNQKIWNKFIFQPSVKNMMNRDDSLSESEVLSDFCVSPVNHEFKHRTNRVFSVYRGDLGKVKQDSFKTVTFGVVVFSVL